MVGSPPRWRRAAASAGARLERLLQRLARRPLIHALLATPLLWLFFGNIVVALSVAALAFLFLAMCHTLLVLNRQAGSPGRTAQAGTARAARMLAQDPSGPRPQGADQHGSIRHGDGRHDNARRGDGRRRRRRPRRAQAPSAPRSAHDEP